MECSRCGEAVEAGAAYCGNCGAALVAVAVGQPQATTVAIQPIIAVAAPAPVAVPAPTVVAPAVVAAPSLTPTQPASPVAPSSAWPVTPPPAPQSEVTQPQPQFQAQFAVQPQVPVQPGLQPVTAAPGLPAYAVVNPAQHKAESKSMIALVLSILALPASILPILGWILAIVAIVMGTTIRSKIPRKTMSNLTVGFGSLAVLLSGGVFVYNIQAYNKEASQTALNKTALQSDSSQSASQTQDGIINTPCFSLEAVGLANIENATDSCMAQAFNADTMVTSTNALNIEAVSQSQIDGSNLAEAGQQIANSYLKSSVPDLTVTSQATGTFANSPAYIIRGKSKGNVTIELALVVHKVDHGENVFVLAHAINDAQADLSQFEDSWVWK